LGSLAFSAPQLVFLRENELGDWKIWTADLNGANQKPIKTSGFIWSAKFISKDQIAVVSDCQIWSINLSTGQRKKLVRFPAPWWEAGELAYSPDGNLFFSVKTSELKSSAFETGLDWAIAKLNIKTGRFKIIKEIQHFDPYPVKFAIVGNTLFWLKVEFDALTGDFNPSLVALDLATKRLQPVVTNISWNIQHIWDLAASRSGKKLLVVLYNYEETQPPHSTTTFYSFEAHNNRLRCINIKKVEGLVLRWGEDGCCWLPGENDYLIGLFYLGRIINGVFFEEFPFGIIKLVGQEARVVIKNGFKPDVWY